MQRRYEMYLPAQRTPSQTLRSQASIGISLPPYCSGTGLDTLDTALSSRTDPAQVCANSAPQVKKEFGIEVCGAWKNTHGRTKRIEGLRAQTLMQLPYKRLFSRVQFHDKKSMTKVTLIGRRWTYAFLNLRLSVSCLLTFHASGGP